jgi:hypothetical protein
MFVDQVRFVGYNRLAHSLCLKFRLAMRIDLIPQESRFRFALTIKLDCCCPKMMWLWILFNKGRDNTFVPLGVTEKFTRIAVRVSVLGTPGNPVNSTKRNPWYKDEVDKFLHWDLRQGYNSRCLWIQSLRLVVRSCVLFKFEDGRWRTTSYYLP